MFGLLGDRAGAEFFVARGNTTFDIVRVRGRLRLRAAAARRRRSCGLAGRIRPALSWGVHLTLVALLAAALVLPPLGDAFGGSALSIAVALRGRRALRVRCTCAPTRCAASSRSLPPPRSSSCSCSSSSRRCRTCSTRARRRRPRSTARRASSTPIVHIVLDELPVSTLVNAKGQIDAELYPNLAKFAARRHLVPPRDDRRGHRRRRPCRRSSPASGRRPATLPTPTTHSHSLFTLFGRSHACLGRRAGHRRLPGRDLSGGPKPPVRARLSALADDLHDRRRAPLAAGRPARRAAARSIAAGSASAARPGQRRRSRG